MEKWENRKNEEFPEQELKYLCDLGVYEKVDEREATREFKSDDRPDLYAGTLPLEAFEVHNLHRNKPQRNFSNHAHRRVTRLPVGDRMGSDAAENWAPLPRVFHNTNELGSMSPECETAKVMSALVRSMA